MNQSARSDTDTSDSCGNTAGHDAAILPIDFESVVHFRRQKNAAIELVRGHIPDWAKGRVHDLAAACIATGQSKQSLLTSPVACLVVAENLPGRSDECVAALFACDVAESSVETTESKMAIVRELANRIAGDATEYLADVPETKADVPDVTWKQLGWQLGRKLLQEFAAIWRRKLKIGFTIAALAAACAMPVPHRVKCKAICEPVLSRFVAAPFDARLESATAVLGQHVTAGDVLATLDAGELESKLANLRDKAAQNQQRLLAALSNGEHAEAEHERLEAAQLRREIDLLEERTNQLQIRSPIDGVVISGDLERAQGTPLSVGDNLFEIASLDMIVVEVAVPERSISYVKNGMRVSIHLDAKGGGTTTSKVDRVHLRNEIRDHASVYIAEALVENKSGVIRPGMSGTASIHAGYEPLAWVLFHRPLQSLRNVTGW